MSPKLVGSLCLGLGVIAGCNTDPVWEPRQKVEAPMTDLENPAGLDIPDLNLTDAKEVDLVEEVLAHRAQYYRGLRALHAYYLDRGYETKALWAQRELRDVERIKPFAYLIGSEVPTDSLVPRDAIPEADAMYKEAVDLVEEGGHGVPFVYREKKMRDALRMFKDLIERYPTSDKIDDAAFYCGEIHKEYFPGEEAIAVKWYERAFEWDPQTPHPARFQAAAVYDLRLHDRDRALELYHDVIDHETFNKSNVTFAVRRIDQLTGEMSAQPPASAFTGQQPALGETPPDDQR